MESWPTAVLPDPVLEVAGEMAENATRTEMASGRFRQKRRFSLDLSFQEVRWTFTDDQFALFRSWAYHKLNGCSDWFELDLTLGGGLGTYKARFVGARYQFARNHPHWTVTAQLEIEEQNYVPEDAFEAALEIGSLDAFEDVAQHLHNFVNTTLPATPTFQP